MWRSSVFRCVTSIRPTHRTRGATTGSNSIKDSGSALRVAAAEARQLLLENAAELLGSPATALTVGDGRIHAGDEYDSVTYWELLEDGRFNTQAGGTCRTEESRRLSPCRRIDRTP